MSYEEVQEEQVDNSHLVFDSSKHSAELIMMGSPSKDKEQKDSPSTEDQRNGIYELQGPTELPTEDTQPTQGPESNPRGCTDESVLEQYARTKLFQTQLPSSSPVVPRFPSISICRLASASSRHQLQMSAT
jgi:hypothetical protein